MRLRSSNTRRVRLTAGGYSSSNPPREQATMPRSTYFDGVTVKSLDAALRPLRALLTPQ